MIKVKPLEWRQLYPDQKAYPMNWMGSGVLRSVFRIEQYHQGGDFYALGTGHKTLETAKQAVQSHYDECVLSAIDPSTN